MPPYASSLGLLPIDEDIVRHSEQSETTVTFHTFSYILQDYVHMLAMPAFQDHSEFFVRLGYPRMMGYCILEYQLGFIKFERVKVELISLV